MRNYQYILIIIILFFVTAANGQISESKKQLNVKIGYNQGLYKNLTLSPVVLYAFNNPFFEIGYLRKTKKNRLFDIHLKYWKSELKTDKTPALNLDYENVGLHLNYLFPIFNKNKLSIHTGIFSRTSLVGFGQIAGEIQQKFALAGRLKYELNNKHTLFTQLSIPILYAIKGNLDFDFYSFRRYIGYNYNLSYAYKLSNKFDITLSYFSRYDKVESTNIFRELQNQFTLGINYNF